MIQINADIGNGLGAGLSDRLSDRLRGRLYSRFNDGLYLPMTDVMEVKLKHRR